MKKPKANWLTTTCNVEMKNNLIFYTENNRFKPKNPQKDLQLTGNKPNSWKVDSDWTKGGIRVVGKKKKSKSLKGLRENQFVWLLHDLS